MLRQEPWSFPRAICRADHIRMKILIHISRSLLGFILLVFAIQLVGGVLLLINRYVPIALTILGPIIVNILLFHSLMNPEGLGLALFVTILWGAVFASVRSAFAGIFQARVEIKTMPERRHSHAVSPA